MTLVTDNSQINNKSKICLIIPGMDAGGIENYVLRYLHYTCNVSNITVMSRSKAKGDLFHLYDKTGVTIRNQGVGYFNIVKWYKLFLFFRQNQFTTVCDFNENFAGIPMLMARLAGVKHRIAFYRRSSHAFGKSRLKLAYARLMNYLVYQNSTTILSNSKHAFNFFFPERHQVDHRFKVIPNGVKASNFDIHESKSEARLKAGLPAGAFIIGHTGRYDSSKNHKTIFKVAKKIIDKHQDVVFLFCGKYTDGEKFKAQLGEHGIIKRVIALGLHNDVPLILRSLDLFYFPSVTEGQPNALIEAVLSGIPLVASDIEPIREALPETYHKYLVKPLDVDGSVRAIEDHYNKNTSFDTKYLKDWATQAFDINKNFKTFEDELR